MTSAHSLERFKQAQEDPQSGFATALGELKRGRKTSHWIWYVFPQLASLGRSSTARFYGVADLQEARDYLGDRLLRERLGEVVEAVAAQLRRGVSVVELMGGETDALKLVSSLTLFEEAARAAPSAGERKGVDAESAALAELFTEVLAMTERQGFSRCAHTSAACAERGY